MDPANGDIYIADGYGNHRVVVFDKNGTFLRQWGGVGSGNGQFAAGDGGHPHCIVLGSGSYLYVCDRGQDRIEVFSKAGVWQRNIMDNLAVITVNDGSEPTDQPLARRMGVWRRTGRPWPDCSRDVSHQIVRRALGWHKKSAGI